MKTQERRKHKTMKGVLVLSLMLTLIGLSACKDNDLGNQRIITPPDATKASTLTSYFPDSGGVATKLILYGTNFGTDTSYIKVTINGKNAKVIGTDGEAIYAIMPSKADTGNIKVHIGKAPNVQVLTYPNKFKYQFNRNVTTVFGQNGLAGTDDGIFTVTKLRRPWFVTFDRDGVLYYLDEGRGTASDGGLRKAYEGVVSTLLRNSTGPMQSPTCIAFNPAQDTLYMLNTLFNANNMTTDGIVCYFTRETGFIQIKPLVKGTYTRATALAIHPITGDIYYNSQNDGYIYKYDRATKAQIPQFQLNGTDTELRMTFSLDGKIMYIMVRNKHCVYKASYNESERKVEKAELFVGQWNSSGFQNGIGTTARFNNPGQGVTDLEGNLYIPDKENNCIRQVTPDGFVSTYAGVPKTQGYKDGDPAVSLFNRPEAVAFSPDGGLYVTDRENQLMRKIMVE